MSIDVSVIIVTYNARELVARCLDSVDEQTAGSGLRVETIVVDNDSSDDTVAWLRAHRPDVRLIATGVNGGMAAGNNVGMAAARGRHFLLLNSDAFLQAGALGALVRAAEVDGDRVGMVVPRLLNEDGSLQRSARSFPTVWRLATEFLYLRKLGPQLNSFYRPDFTHEAASDDVDWFMGAAMLVPRRAVDAVGLMDEAFFMYGEEVDWQRRMRDAGLVVRFEPGARVVHLGGGSSRQAWGRMYASQVRNHVRYVALHHGVRAARRAARMISLALGVRATIYRVGGLVPGGAADARRARARAFAGARRGLRDVDVATLADRRRIPTWG